MSFKECKIPINDTVKKYTSGVLGQIEKFEAMLDDPRFGKLDRHFQKQIVAAAIREDNALLPALQDAMMSYSDINEKLARALAAVESEGIDDAALHSPEPRS